MHEFPPSLWKNQNVTVIGVLCIVLIGIIAPLIVARYTKPTRRWIVSWGILATVASWVGGFWSAGADPVYDPQQYLLLLPVFLCTISGAVIVYMWWICKSGRGLVEYFLLLAFFFWIVYGLSAPAGVVDPTSFSRLTQCRNNLKQIGFAFHNYHDTYHSFPPATLERPTTSWRIALLPFMEEAKVAEEYDKAQAWDSPANMPLQKQRILAYSCPSRVVSFDSTGRFLTSYVVPRGAGTIFDSPTGKPISSIKDGTSNTLLALEACGTRIIWTQPIDVDSSSYKVSVNGPGTIKGQSGSMISSWHYGGAQVLLADGSSRFLKSTIDVNVLRSLLTEDGGDVPGDAW
ncbi:MAG: DUF1559 domain-containing protein [Planctomycetaceae bacterium]|nr:DUF1559 domain-containing protein [Planctomycetaceae bacterium]